jgi:hypothetical protein
MSPPFYPLTSAIDRQGVSVGEQAFYLVLATTEPKTSVDVIQ